MPPSRSRVRSPFDGFDLPPPVPSVYFHFTATFSSSSMSTFRIPFVRRLPSFLRYRIRPAGPALPYARTYPSSIHPAAAHVPRFAARRYRAARRTRRSAHARAHAPLRARTRTTRGRFALLPHFTALFAHAFALPRRRLLPTCSTFQFIQVRSGAFTRLTPGVYPSGTFKFNYSAHAPRYTRTAPPAFGVARAAVHGLQRRARARGRCRAADARRARARAVRRARAARARSARAVPRAGRAPRGGARAPAQAPFRAARAAPCRSRAAVRPRAAAAGRPCRLPPLPLRCARCRAVGCLDMPRGLYLPAGTYTTRTCRAPDAVYPARALPFLQPPHTYPHLQVPRLTYRRSAGAYPSALLLFFT